MRTQSGTVAQPQVSHSVGGTRVSQIIMKREVCLHGKRAADWMQRCRISGFPCMRWAASMVVRAALAGVGGLAGEGRPILGKPRAPKGKG